MRERETAQRVLGQRIDSGLVVNDVRPGSLQHPRQVPGEHVQVDVVAGAVGQSEVQARALLAEREVVLAVHAEGEDLGVSCEHRRGAVSLVDVEVHHQRAADAALGLESPDAHRDVVEDAVALAVVRERVVRPPGEVSADALGKRARGGRARAAHGCQRAENELAAPGKAETAQLGLGETVLQHGLHPPRRVHAEERIDLRRLGGNQLLRLQDARGEQRLPEQAVLAHGEAMPLRKRNDVVVRMKNAHDGGRSLHRSRQFLEVRRAALRPRMPRCGHWSPVQW